MRRSHQKSTPKDVHSSASATKGFPIASRLLPELLSDIMLQVMKSYNESWLSFDTYYQVSNSHAYDWFPLAMVCQHWRDVALCTPSLWSLIILKRKPHFPEMLLSRSQDVPISVQVTNMTSPDSLELVLRELPRIQRMFIDGGSGTVKNRIFQHLTDANGAPSLHTLRIDNRDLQEPCRFPLPQLKHLRVSFHAPKHVLTLVRPSLTRLVLHTSSPAVSADSVLQVLSEQMPHLETLVIERALYHLDEPGWRSLPCPTRTVSLPHLRTLRLRGEWDSPVYAYFLSHLSFPKTAYLEFDCYPTQPTSDLVVPLLFRLWRRLPLCGITMLSDVVVGTFMLSAQSYPRGDPSSSPGPFVPNLKLSICTPGWIDLSGFRRCQEATVSAIVDIIPLQNLQTLGLLGEWRSVAGPLRSIVQRSRVNVLHVDQLSLLTLFLPDGLLREGPSLPLPNLDTLHVQYRPSFDGARPPNLPASVLTKLKDVLRRRCRIRHIQFHSYPDTMSGDISNIRYLFPAVRFDTTPELLY